jgi:hypothetical protein
MFMSGRSVAGCLDQQPPDVGVADSKSPLHGEAQPVKVATPRRQPSRRHEGCTPHLRQSLIAVSSRSRRAFTPRTSAQSESNVI